MTVKYQFLTKSVIPKDNINTKKNLIYLLFKGLYAFNFAKRDFSLKIKT